MKINCI